MNLNVKINLLIFFLRILAAIFDDFAVALAISVIEKLRLKSPIYPSI